MRLPEPGEAVGPYTCLRLLASGGMGAVYEARHRDLPRSVALKLLLAPEDPELVVRFHREAEACGRLSHPNVVVVHDSGTIGPACYLVMELVAGESLQEVLAREGPASPDRVRDWIAQAAAGIAHAHAAGVLHRDLKPANLLWDQERGRVCVVDFGLTGRLSAADSLTATGEVMGTPGYLAPEQVGAFEGKTDVRTDVYGLGATLFALLAGRPPFLGAGLAGLAAVASDSAPDLRSLREEVDPELAALVASCLQKDPDLRPSSADQVQRVLDGRASAAPRALSRGRRRRLLVGAAGVGLLLLLAAGGLAVQRGAAGVRAAEAYGAWRSGPGEGFSYGYGEPGAGFEERLRSWAAELDANAAPEEEAWRAARRDVRAQLRLLAARAGRDPGPARGEPPLGPEDHLAQAVIDLRAERAPEAARALGEVRGLLARSQAALRARVALEALSDPVGFLDSLRARRGPERALAGSHFAGALLAAAPEASSKDLLRWHDFAQRAGWEPAAALRGAIERSVARRQSELERTSLRERGIYLRSLCGPLREAGLWPGSAFQSFCREQFAAELQAQLELPRGASRKARALDLIHLEHELFYRVDPTPCWTQDYQPMLQEPELSRRGSIVDRALLRYDRQPPEIELKVPDSVARTLAKAPESGSRLEATVRWWKQSEPSADGCSRAQRGLLRLLTSGVPDLTPDFVSQLFHRLRGSWNLRHTSSQPPLPGEVEQLTRLARVEFKRALPWVVNLPRRNCALDTGRIGFVTVWAWLYAEPREGRVERALRNFGVLVRELEALEPPEADAKADDEGVGLTIADLYGSLAELARQEGFLAETLPHLVEARERMARRRPASNEFSQFWSGLVQAQALADQAGAVATINELRLDECCVDARTALAVAQVFEGTSEAKRALPGLRRGLEWVDRAKNLQPAEREEMLPKLRGYLESCSR